jgi:hypothetical protein
VEHADRMDRLHPVFSTIWPPIFEAAELVSVCRVRLCGVLWECWNYRSGAKWHCSVPIMEHLKIFEMPLPGYLGFPPFAVECVTMYAFVRALTGRTGRLAL